MIPIIFLIGLGFLLWFTYVDLKHSEIGNIAIVVFFLVGLMSLVARNESIATVLVMALILGLTYILWRNKAIGGADAKLIPCIIPFLDLSGIANIFVGTWFFIIFFMVIGTLYGLVGQFILKKKVAPFLPAITLTYLCFWIFKIFWK